MTADAIGVFTVQQTFNEFVLSRQTCLHIVLIAAGAICMFTEHQTTRKCVCQTSEVLLARCSDDS
jgi:hypothetical protein